MYRICFLYWVFASCRFFLPQIEAEIRLACLDSWTFAESKGYHVEFTYQSVWEGRKEHNGMVWKRFFKNISSIPLFESLIEMKEIFRSECSFYFILSYACFYMVGGTFIPLRVFLVGRMEKWRAEKYGEDRKIR